MEKENKKLELELTKEDWLSLSVMAHEYGMTLEDLIERIIKEMNKNTLDINPKP